MKPFYTVAYGCDSRHLTDIKVFNLLREANKFINSLDDAYLLQRHVEKTQFDRETTDLKQKVM